ncbi:phosphonate ABC transporter ATP-binding protein [Porphyromonas crevioricanis]|uniref:Methionine import ATP-binding protein MetN n=2 Tax=Porphyromonas crevioricanis TaxID=393921 RepID=A0A0A2FCY1_9PORP|nr:ATP-binding cassette domain-containing protein [Porphyromonas crevioricanis]KGN88876.1 phosphonate ABC transporter ATP-binding protein [Porphyromonas crevioricanis]KGN95851.1 phosphonate ABC transporter ATP-binding protein [Porphyromonas crevioricanis]SJZ73680.1 phospholipid/cholesterol/gamma-HCH transport system ATP-binding protein [Porphyromonas crevioricanis]SQH73482.1 Methionine import ATP-binding protein MetN [Porphyromonas crevioricanis]GAD04888.1 methionine ABC transporter ATP-bindin
MIEVKQLVKVFEDRTVLDGLNITFETGKTNLIIGRSGAGKTVLLKCVIGLIEPTSGAVLYDGRDLVKMQKSELLNLRREVGMLFQGSALFDSMTVMENVLFPMEMLSKMSKAQRKDRATDLLERVGLIDARHKYPSDISGGMMKRAAIARALALEPRYLFCDEPNSGLDPKTSITIDELIHGLTAEFGITTIVNTHDMNSVRKIGDKIIFLRKGKKEWEGSSATIDETDSPVLLSFINAAKMA